MSGLWEEAHLCLRGVQRVSSGRCPDDRLGPRSQVFPCLVGGNSGKGLQHLGRGRRDLCFFQALHRLELEELLDPGHEIIVRPGDPQ